MVAMRAKPWQTLNRKVFMMQEILTAVTYLVVWLVCQRIIGIESGLTTLLISLTAAVSVYVIIAVKDYRDKRRKGDLKD